MAKREGLADLMGRLTWGDDWPKVVRMQRAKEFRNGALAIALRVGALAGLVGGNIWIWRHAFG